MVLLYYYNQRGSSCLDLLKHEKFPTKVLLHPFEGWASPSLNVTWLIKPVFLSSHKVLVTELYGGVRKWSAVAKLRCAPGDPATILVVGKRRAPSNAPRTARAAGREVAAHLGSLLDLLAPGPRLRQYTPLRPAPDVESGGPKLPPKAKGAEKVNFRLTLSTKVSDADFHLGYCAAGTLEYGSKRLDKWTLAYYSLVRRREMEPANSANAPTTGNTSRQPATR